MSKYSDEKDCGYFNCFEKDTSEEERVENLCEPLYLRLDNCVGVLTVPNFI